MVNRFVLHFFTVVVLCAATVSALDHKQYGPLKQRALNEETEVAIKRPWKPFPSGKDVFTQAKYLARKRDWFTRLQLDAYDKYGSHSPTWDDDFRQLMQRWGAYACAAPREEQSTPGELESLLQLSGKLHTKGCNDPWAVFLYGLLLDINHKTAEGMPYMVKAAKDLEASPRSRILPYIAQRLLAQKAYKAQPMRGKDYWFYEKLKWKNLALAASGPDLAEDASLFFGEFFRTDWKIDGHNSTAPLCLKIFQDLQEKTQTIPEWIQAFVQGNKEYRLAIDAQGMENTGERLIKPASMAHLHKALECFDRAGTLRPDCPEIALAMFEAEQRHMLVAAGFNATEWFNRAVAGRFDCERVYAIYSSMLAGGGTNSLRYLFGKDCMDTNRYDTSVPWMYPQVCQALAFGCTEDGAEFYRNQLVYNRMCDFFTKAIATPNMSNDGRDFNRAHFAIIQFLAGHLQEAVTLLETVDKKNISPDTFHDYQLTYKSMMGCCRLTLGENRENFRKVQGLLVQGRKQTAYPLLKELQAKVAKDPEALSVIAEYLYPIEQQKNFAEGKWTDMMPGEEMCGWTGQDEWNMNPDGTLVGVTGLYVTYAICKTEFTDNFEYTGEVEMPVPGKIFIVLGDRGYWEGDQHGGIFLLPKPPVNVQVFDMSEVEDMRHDCWDFEHALEKRFTFHVQVWGYRVWLYLNDVLVLAGEPICSKNKKIYPGLRGIGGMANYPGFTMKCRNFQIRRLTSEPVTTAAPQGVVSRRKPTGDDDK